MPIKHLIAFCICSLCISTHIHAQSFDRDTLNISLSVSGGASLGSYQAGLNWTLINFMKEVNDKPWFIRNFQVEAAPYYNLTGISGSSAGNINSLLSTIEWYKKDVSKAEESVFWETWINIGFEQLFPYGVKGSKDHNGGIFHREYFDNYTKDILFKELSNNIRETDDAIDIGVTLTRLEPAILSIDGSEVKTQRYVTSYTTRPIINDGKRVVTFTLNDAIIYNEGTNQNFGQLILPVFSRGEGFLRKRFDEVTEINKASSAIPFFFEPVQIPHYNTFENTGEVQNVDFVDGGMFDNRPLDLSIKLYQARYGVPENGIDEKFQLIFLDVQNRRKQDKGSNVQKEKPAKHGIQSAITLFNAFISSARHYELEVLYRSIDSGVFDRVEATNRYSDVVGSFFGAFGSFFGKPFREYDFYTGIYDGLYYIADRLMEQVLECSGDCEELKALVIEDLFYSMNLSLKAKYVVNRHYRSEFNKPSLLVDQDAFEKLEEAPYIMGVFDAFEKYNEDISAYNLLSDGEKAKRKEPYVKNFFERYGEYAYTDSVGTSTTIKNALLSNKSKDVREHNTNYEEKTPLLDKTFKEAVTNFDEFEQLLFGNIFQQWWRVENKYTTLREGNQNWEFAPEIAQFTYFKANPYKLKGFNPSPTIIPNNHLGFVKYLIPYHASLNLNDPGFEFGYNYFITKDRFYVPFEPIIRNLKLSNALMFRIGLGYDVVLNRTNRIGLSVGTQRKYSGTFEDIAKFPINTASLHFDLGNTIRFSGELTDGRLSPLFGEHKPIFGFKIGIVDLNGLLYWTGRILK